MQFKSYDKKSHYPATMTMRDFPFYFTRIEKNKTELLRKLHEENKQHIRLTNYKKFKYNMTNVLNAIDNGIVCRTYSCPTKNAFLCEVTLADVQIKTYGLNCMPLIAMSKSDISPSEYVKKSDIIVDNGKLLKAPLITIKCTDIDLLSYELMYTFKIAVCKQLEVSYKFKPADDYIQSTIRYHLVKKNEISLLKTGKKKIDELRDFTGEPLFTEEAVENFNRMTQEQQKDFIDFHYSETKSAGLNNQYGINVQRIVNDNIFFNLQEYRYQKDENQIQGCFGTQTTRDYLTGVYITAYARLDLAFLTYMIYRECDNTTVVYWDTDSVKLLIPDDGELMKVEKLINWYNMRIGKVRQSYERRYGELYNLGIWDDDGTYKFFYSMGAKKYIVCYDNDNIVVTNSGINKKIFSNYLDEKYHEYQNDGLSDYEAFRKILRNYYHPNVNLGSDVTGRKVITYPYMRDTKVRKTLPDEFGKRIKVNQYPCALIADCDYLLSSTRNYSLLNKQHYQLCKTLQRGEGIRHECNTDYNEVGKITQKTTDDFSDFLIDN